MRVIEGKTLRLLLDLLTGVAITIITIKAELTKNAVSTLVGYLLLGVVMTLVNSAKSNNLQRALLYFVPLPKTADDLLI